MIKKRIAALAATIVVSVTAAAIPVLAASHLFYPVNAVTYSTTVTDTYTIQGVYPGCTTTQVRSSASQYSASFKEAWYYEYSKTPSGNNLLYQDHATGNTSTVHTDMEHTPPANTNLRIHCSKLYETYSRYSSIIETVDSVVRTSM